MTKIYHTSETAKNKIKKGIDTIVDALKLAHGPNGGNAIIKRQFLTPLATNDAKEIVDAWELDDETEDLGRELVKQAIDTVNSLVGDGRKTTALLLQSVLDVGMKKLNSITHQHSPMVVRKEINEACKAITAELNLLATEIKTEEDIANVATISVESREIGEIIAKMFKRLGKGARIKIQDGFNGIIETETVRGAEIEAGLPHKQLANNSDETEYFEANPTIAITNIPIESTKQISDLIAMATKQDKKSLILICEQFTSALYELMIQIKLSGEFTLIPIKAPTVTKSYLLEDLAVMLNTKLCDKETSSLSKIEFGTCDRISIVKGKTTFLETPGDSTNRVAELEAEIKKADSLYDREKLQQRIENLSGGIGVIRVDGVTDTERGYLKLKIRDAVNATRRSYDGIVKGGGYSLKQVSDKMEKNILTDAITVPYQLILDSGITDVPDNVIDPVKVVRTALEVACSQAGLILTGEITIADKREKAKDQTLDD